MAHWMGTDENGRDVLTRVAFGVPAGLLAGFAEGWVDVVLSRIVDAMLACPFLILAIALAAFLGPDLTNAMIAIGVSTAPRFMRVARAATLDASSNDYVEAARAIGNPGWRVAVRHVLPNIVPPLMVQGTLAVAAAIIAEASLSFLGLGQQPPSPSWGSMLNSAQRFLSQAPWLAVFPGLAIFLAVLSFNLGMDCATRWIHADDDLGRVSRSKLLRIIFGERCFEVLIDAWIAFGLEPLGWIDGMAIEVDQQKVRIIGCCSWL